MTDTEKGPGTAGDDELEVRAIETAGATWKAFVDRSGQFRAHHPLHGDVKGMRWDELEEKARKATAAGRVKVSVPYARMAHLSKGWRVVTAEATGIHGGSGNILVRDHNGKAGQLDGYGARGFFRPPSPEDAAEMVRLADARDKADLDLRALVGRHGFPGGITAVVKEAVERARKGGE